MNNTLRNLSVVEVYHRIKAYNRELGEFLLEENMEGFEQTIDDFLACGITENPHFEDALTVYRIARPHYYIEGIPSDIVIQALQNKGYFMDIPATFPQYDDATIMSLAAIAEELKTPSIRRKGKATVPQSELEAHFSELITLFDEFISFNTTPSYGNYDKKQLQKDCYYKFIAPMTDHRRAIDCHIDFNKLAIKSFDAESVLYDSIAEEADFFGRLSAIEKLVAKSYDIVYQAESTLQFKDFYKIDQPYAETKDEKAKYSESQLLIGLGYYRAAFSDMGRGKYPDYPFAYIALAMFLSIPSTSRIEAFINKFGYSLSDIFTCLHKKEIFGKKYHFYGEHFKKWFNSGIDYYLIYQLLSKDWGQPSPT